MSVDTSSKFEPSFADIERLDPAGCLDRWREVFERSPPKYLSSQFMKRVLICELQNRTLGGLSARTARRLNQIASGPTSTVRAQPGTHLVREWNGRTDQVVAYMIDRLTRSLADFAKLVDRLDAAETSFLSVTQSFNTATSMGRLTLNMLLSFAQFGREGGTEPSRQWRGVSR